jgi:2-aminobenzoate-CoA ligase
MSEASGHIDAFARERLPPGEQWPVFDLGPPVPHYPPRLNCGVELLDAMVAASHGDRPVLRTARETLTYRQLLERSNRLARVLTEDLGLVPGNRVLIRAANNPTFVAAWFAVAKAGGIVVATMPLLRARELAVILDKAAIGLALCDERLAEEMEAAVAKAPVCRRVAYFNGSGQPGSGAELDKAMARKPIDFANCDTAADDVVLIAFTSGTTGKPKGTMHFHRDVLAMCDSFSRFVLKPRPDDIFIGSPPIAFTFGLGGLVAFPMRVGASTVLIETPSPDNLLQAIAEFRATTCFTAPTAYRRLADKVGGFDVTSLRRCVSAGETLPLPTFEAWRNATGIRIIDGIGATEMLHIFISAADDDIRPGATGKPVPGYRAMVVDEAMQPLPPGQVGCLAVRGPTGCRYLADERQKDYVVQGWNLTGDAYRMDEDGYFWFQARTDDMIVSGGYNIAGPEIEEALLEHEAVAECAVIGAPNPDRTAIVKAFVVLRDGQAASPVLAKALQDFVKQRIAPYKYPRAIEFADSLPRTETGKVQRFVLRQREIERARAKG